MNKDFFLSVFLILFISVSGICITPVINGPILSQQGPVKDDQNLYNGKEWVNRYTAIRGDQFLFSKVFLDGTVTINGKTYSNISLNYDIYNDQLLIPAKRGIILQLNKEIVDSFTLVLENKTYRFFNTDRDSLQNIKGFVKVLYEGKSSLYVKYKKEIQPLAVEEKYDLFFRTYRVYYVRGNQVDLISSKNELLKVLNDRRDQIKDFLKKNRIKLSKKDPESFVPVIRYYDSLGD
jgi:hypothetical protein